MRKQAHSTLRVNVLVFVLSVLVFCSAGAVVLVKHYGRVEVMRAQELRNEYDELKLRWYALQVERNALVTHARIQTLAERDHGMHIPTRDRTQMVLIDEDKNKEEQ